LVWIYQLQCNVIEYTDMRMSSCNDMELHVEINIGIIDHRDPMFVMFFVQNLTQRSAVLAGVL
jgi:hypothetical protein